MEHYSDSVQDTKEGKYLLVNYIRMMVKGTIIPLGFDCVIFCCPYVAQIRMPKNDSRFENLIVRMDRNCNDIHLWYCYPFSVEKVMDGLTDEEETYAKSVDVSHNIEDLEFGELKKLSDVLEDEINNVKKL